MNSPIPGTTIQSLMFPKELYTPARAASWARRNGFEGSAPDVGSPTAAMLRVRLKAPTKFVEGSFRTALLEDGVKAVVGVPVARRNPATRTRVNGDVLPFRRRGAPVPMKHYVGDSDEDVSDAPTVERAIRAPRSFSVSDMVARGHAWEADRSRGYQSTWYPDGARYGQRIVSIEQSGGKFRVTFGMASRDDSGRFEVRAARSAEDRSFKTEAGAKRAALKWLEGDSAARRNPLRRNTVVGDHVQVHSYTRKLPKQARRLPVPVQPVIVEAPVQQQAKPAQSADDKRYFAALKKKYYALVADTVEAMKQKQWLHAETLSRTAEDILLGDGWHTKWGQAALSPLYTLKKKIHKARHPYSQNPSQEATMAGRPKSRARRNPVHLHTSYGPGDKGKHRVLDQALDVAAMAKSLPAHKVYTFVSPANTPENAVAKIDVVLNGSQVASFLVKPKTHTVVMAAGPVDHWFHEAKYRTSSDAIRKIAKWAEGASAKTNPHARRNPLTVNPSRKAGAYALFVKGHIRKHLNAGLSAPEAMRAVAAEWRAKKAGAMRANPRKRR